MGFITLLVLLGGFAWLAVLGDRRIRRRKQARLAAEATQPPTEPQLNQNGRIWRRSQPSEEVHAFRAWAVATFANQPALQHWLAALSDEAIQLLTTKIVDFCIDLGF